MADSTLAASLVAALAELTTIDRGRTAKIDTKGGGSFSYSYADIADVVAETRPVLAKNGLVALTPVSGSERGLACTVTLVHESGAEMVFEPLPFVASTDAQQAGSAITYFRRYALLAALGMATKDDDGAAAKGSTPARPPTFSKAQAKNLLVDLVGADDAAEAWEFGKADGWGDWTPARVNALAKQWNERPMDGPS